MQFLREESRNVLLLMSGITGRVSRQSYLGNKIRKSLELSSEIPQMYFLWMVLRVV